MKPIQRAKSRIKRMLREQPELASEIPGQSPVRLVAYYDELAEYYPKCEMETKRWLVENVRDDWVILDCGANIGYFTVLLSRLTPRGHVHAFEPTDTHAMLLRNLEANEVSHGVTAVKAALGTSTGKMSADIQKLWGHEVARDEFEFTSVDDYVVSNGLERVDCIKIDVDSYDFDVLMGAEKTLERFDPALIVELYDVALDLRGYKAVEVLAWLAERGYTQAVVLEQCNYLLKRGEDLGAHAPPQKGMTLYFR